ncbi:MAG: hypothetical protein KatS3mg060_0782 [Dehalococcoidia bacterium]|jgi:predicted DCC family thiol-disulfide oxidoreductase YuxK|nr:MAG: hypothetical protein KatS3mg060_0782 [Dehalococcoidia bacterium]
MDQRDWLLIDGECGFCRRSADWIRRQDRRGRFRIIPYQEAPLPPMTEELRAACAQAMHVVTADGQTLRAGRAALYVLAAIGHPRLAGLLGLPPLLPFVELAYRIVANNRPFFSRLFFTKETPR